MWINVIKPEKYDSLKEKCFYTMTKLKGIEHFFYLLSGIYIKDEGLIDKIQEVFPDTRVRYEPSIHTA